MINNNNGDNDNNNDNKDYNNKSSNDKNSNNNSNNIYSIIKGRCECQANKGNSIVTTNKEMLLKAY